MGASSRRAALLLVLILNRIASAASETEREWFMREGAQRGEAKKRRGRMGDEMMKMREYYCAQEPAATICATLRGDATEGRRRMPRHPPKLEDIQAMHRVYCAVAEHAATHPCQQYAKRAIRAVDPGV
jgi:hypothetical protein